MRTILRLSFPLAIIFFILFTKWWIADIVDGADAIMYGFPLIYKSPAFHTSMAQQYFIIEFVIDFLFYFITVSIILFFINKSISKIRRKRTLLITIYIIAGLLFSIEIVFATIFETNFSIKRDFDIEVKHTGFKFYFSNTERVKFNKLHQ